MLCAVTAGTLVAAAAATWWFLRRGETSLRGELHRLQCDLEDRTRLLERSEAGTHRALFVRTQFIVAARDLSETSSLERVLEMVAEQMHECVGCCRAIVWLGSGASTLRAAVHYRWLEASSDSLDKQAQELPAAPPTLVAHAAQNCLLVDSESCRREPMLLSLAAKREHPFILAPLRVKGGIMGMLEFDEIADRREGGLPMSELVTSADFLSNIGGMAIKNCQALNEARRLAGTDGLGRPAEQAPRLGHKA